MASPYKQFCDVQAKKANRRPIHTLKRGKLYPVYKFEVVKSQFKNKEGEYGEVLLAYFLDACFRFFTYMPCDFANSRPNVVQDMMKDIEDGRAASICLYGQMGTKNVVRIHGFGEGVDEELLETMTLLENEYQQPAFSPEKASGSRVQDRAEREYQKPATSPGKRSGSSPHDRGDVTPEKVSSAYRKRGLSSDDEDVQPKTSKFD